MTLSVFGIIFPRCFTWHLSSWNLISLFSGSVYNLLRAIFLICLSSLVFFKLPNLVIRLPQISSTVFEIPFAHLCVDLASMQVWISMLWFSILKNKPLILLRYYPQPIRLLNSLVCIWILPVIGYNSVSLTQNQVILTNDIVLMDMLVEFELFFSKGCLDFRIPLSSYNFDLCFLSLWFLKHHLL